MDIDFTISDEQAEKFAAALYYGSDLIVEIQKCISDNKSEYAEYLKEVDKAAS